MQAILLNETFKDGWRRILIAPRVVDGAITTINVVICPECDAISTESYLYTGTPLIPSPDGWNHLESGWVCPKHKVEVERIVKIDGKVV